MYDFAFAGADGLGDAFDEEAGDDAGVEIAGADQDTVGTFQGFPGAR